MTVTYAWNEEYFERGSNYAELLPTGGSGFRSSFQIERTTHNDPAVIMRSCLYESDSHNLMENFSFDSIPGGSWEDLVAAFADSQTPEDALEVARTLYAARGL